MLPKPIYDPNTSFNQMSFPKKPEETMRASGDFFSMGGPSKDESYKQEGI